MTDTTLDTISSNGAGLAQVAATPMLVLVWSGGQLSRLGEALIPDSDAAIFGRTEPTESGDAKRVELVRQRPGLNERTKPLDDRFISRSQLRVSREGERIHVENLGKRALIVRGEPVAEAEVGVGDLVELKGHMLFLCVQRPRVFAPIQGGTPSHPFGEADAGGVVGESPASWELREQIAFVARRSAHVLVLGESGTGKELVARAIHAGSSRKDRKLVARNAATIPGGLIDAELFGHVANYPNVGMPERLGLIGEAHGSTLFLDEIGELSANLQAHLLRVLDRGGEYQRLGESRSRSADFRLVAATNRGVAELKHDFAARMRMRLTIAGLNDRREDIPLIAIHLLRREAREDPEIGQRFFEGWDGAEGTPRLDLRFVEALVSHPYQTHVRELDALLWRSLSTSKGNVIELTPELRQEIALPLERRAPRTSEVTLQELNASMERNGGVQEKVWRDLGLASRHVLSRLLRKHAITAK